MKPCPHCGKELPQEMQFCPYCMEKLITETVIGDTPVRRRRRWWLWIVIVIVILLLLCGLWLWRPWQPPPAPKSEKTAASVGGRITTTTTVVSANPSTTTAANATQTEATSLTSTATTTQSTATTHTTVPTAGTSTASAAASASRGSSAVTTTSTAAVCAVGHDWQSITQTVHVDEVGHYETKTVEKRVTLFRCALCYKEFGVLEDYYAHFDAQHDGDSLQAIFRDRYETVTEYREVEEQTWVVDTPAHDKTITVGRQCRICGKTENDQDKE